MPQLLSEHKSKPLGYLCSHKYLLYMFTRFQTVFDYSVLPGWLRNDKKRVRPVVSVSQKTFSESLHRFTQR